MLSGVPAPSIRQTRTGPQTVLHFLRRQPFAPMALVAFRQIDDGQRSVVSFGKNAASARRVGVTNPFRVFDTYISLPFSTLDFLFELVGRCG